jgi:hypothetical protein
MTSLALSLRIVMTSTRCGLQSLHAVEQPVVTFGPPSALPDASWPLPRDSENRRHGGRCD